MTGSRGPLASGGTDRSDAREPASPPAVDGSFYRELVRATSEGVVTIDEAGTIVFADARLGELLGYEPASLVGEPCRKLLPERTRGESQRGAEECHANGGWQPDRSDAKISLLRADGREIPVRCSLTEQSTGDRTLLSVVVREVINGTGDHPMLERNENILW